jgi:IS30 family transposase
MKTYEQITTEERYTIGELRKQGLSKGKIAKRLGRHRSTIYREIDRNLSRLGSYRPSKAVEKTNGRRSRSRKKPQFGEEEIAIVFALIEMKWSPDQVSNMLRINGILCISHETIYQYIWYDKRKGGRIFEHLRHSRKRRRKRYGSHDSRGVMRGKRALDERPISAQNRSRIGHWEIDTVMGKGGRPCILTMVDRKTGYLIIWKLKSRTTAEVNAALFQIIQTHRVKSITADNGTEFHQFRIVEEKTGVLFYFAKPYHSWERGSNENANGLIRQYLPKSQSMTKVTQEECEYIAWELNNRPRKRYGYRTPEEIHA